MQAYGTQLKDFYQRELVALRQDAEVFARAHPAEAAALGLGKSGSRDPQVEMLIQAFAFLTGRVQYEMETSKAALANALLEDLYPHLASPLPCMAVAQVRVQPDAADGKVLERGRLCSATVQDDRGNRVACRFRTTSALPLAPLVVTEVELLQPQAFPEYLHDERVLGALRVRVARSGAAPIQALKNTVLRFYLDANQKHAFLLQELLAVNLVGITTLGLETGAQPRAQPANLGWLGFREDEAALAGRPNMHPGHRILQEYFAFPPKFMFFETARLDFTGLVAGFDLVFHFDVPIPASARTSWEVLKLNCVPLVNLYPQRIDPLPMDQTQYEYWLRADLQGHQHCEIHSVLELTSVKPDGSLRTLRPYFEMESAALLEEQDYFYVLRREENQLGEVAGTEAFISFLDTAQQPAAPPPEVLGGRALCTNRRLPEKLVSGQVLMLEGPAPATGLVLVSPPSPHDMPSLTGKRPWTLVSQLSLNHLSLAEGAQALSALKGLLRAHVAPSDTTCLKLVDGVRRVACQPVMRPLERAGVWSMVQALHVRLTLDRSQFERGDTVLFASVLRHFLTLYASVNTLIEVSLETTDSNRILKQWLPLTGSQLVL